MFESVTNLEWLRFGAIQDRALQKALKRPEFVRIGSNGQREINIFWLYPWAWSDDSENPRFSATAVAVRAAWPAHARYNKENFLPEARRRRYL